MDINNESLSHFVCSRGILKSCDIHSLTPSSSIRYLMNYPSINIKNDYIPTIYVCNSAMYLFATNIIKNINLKFILVSGDSDDDMPNQVLDNELFNTFINNPLLIHWFSQNWIGQHPKATLIPIGLDYHTMASSTCWGPITSVNEQENQLLEIKNNSNPFWKRIPKCYSNFHFFMTTKHGYDRIDAKNNISSDVIVFENEKIERLKTWNVQKDYVFVVSPHGNGLDCHRTWEALTLGCIPIVKSSKIDSLYDELPVLIVNDWNEVNQELLDKTIKNYKDRQFNLERLTLKYWIDKINSYK
jgi:hypothetical protein